MSVQEVRVVTESITPLLMHRYAGEKPSQEKAPRGGKTQSHIDKQRQAQWLEAAYFANGAFHIPPENIEAALAEKAKSIRKGKDFKAGLMVLDDFVPLRVYKSREDKTGEVLTGDLPSFYRPEYIDIRGVRVQQARIDRCRPIFRFWSVNFTLQYDDEVITPENIEKVIGRFTLGDFRPRFGQCKAIAI